MNLCGVSDWKVTPHPAILERVHTPVNRLADFEDSLRGSAFDAPEFRGRVRQRPFVVSDVRISDLPAEMADPGSRKEHFVNLSSVEDEGLGEELQNGTWGAMPGEIRPFTPCGVGHASLLRRLS